MSRLRRFVSPIFALAVGISALTAPALAQDQTFRIADPEGGEIEAGVWLPETSDGAARPLVVISHGNGGWYRGHHDAAEALARAGFVVAALTHPGDNWRDDSRSTQLSDRPRHLSLLIDHMTGEWSGPVAIDDGRIGAFGFSAGAFTVTSIIGGDSDPALIARHCEEEPEVFVCGLLAQQPIDTAAWRPRNHDPRVKAAVIAGPALGMAFTGESLAAVRIPIQLWQAADDEILPSPFNAEPIRDRLGRAPEYHLVADAGHFDFLPPCAPEMAAQIPALCRSKPGFDRAAFHETFNREVVRFFSETI
ncbi:alpha/beta hydrolase family protein [Brevundimonas lenta]|uniref:Putative dienelactone hydrolase n=1 Tax=Brevundimonas lenta TaxID=424796 RepID=A0A7W6NQR9_9CAUL|nr:dienelactone hydrolase [Brevundimonas lenta]MBB4083914.1 putative dienelactone hydrolase [Brevundimonas lenta]